MSCSRMEKWMLPYVEGRLNEAERREVEKHLADCAACRLRVNEFRAVEDLLGELPVMEPSPAFDVRVRARVAAEPARKSWWATFLPSPRVALAASMLLLAMVWIGSRPTQVAPSAPMSVDTIVGISQDLPVLEDYDVVSSFEPLTVLPEPVQPLQQENNN